MRAIAALVLLCSVGAADARPVAAQASMRLRYDAAEARGPGDDGSWLRSEDNATGSLAWGASYAMMSFLVMFEATGDVRYLERLTWIADGVLEQRDSVRGVTDWRGESNPCWQSTSYGDDVPYCWAVHTGMIAYPLAELAAVVARRPETAGAPAWDGTTIGDKAAVYLAAAIDAAASHDADWRDEGAERGYYVFAADATFTARPGRAMPLNQMNAMGRLHLAVADAGGDATHADRARRLAEYLRVRLVSTSAGGYAWAYWPDPYSPPGEDISHAAINVGLAARAARSGVVFGDAHLRAFAITAFDQVYVDTRTTYDHVGGSGATNGGSYRAQFGRWLVLDGADPRIHAAVRATLDPYTTTTSGSVLLGFALVAATDRPQVPHRFYVADWDDLGDRRRATAYGANILIRPPDAAQRYLVPLRYRTSRRTLVQQWDGDAYHTVAKLAPTGGETATAMIPYDPSIYFDYADGVLFQFDDAFVAGAGIEVWNSETGEPPVITSTPQTMIAVDGDYSYEPTVAGATPVVFTAELPAPPPAVRFDASTGRIEFTATSTEPRTFTLRAHNDWGVDEQTWTVHVLSPARDAGAATGDAGSTSDAGTTARSDAGMRGGPPATSDDGCGCRAARSSERSPPIGILFVAVAAMALALRRRTVPCRRTIP